MFKHQKELLFPVNVKNPNPAFAAAVLEQFGGANGELKACLQYFAQSFATKDPEIRDLLLDIATEEISHLEMVGECITQLMGAPDTDPNTLGVDGRKMVSEGTTMGNANGFLNNMINQNSTVQKSLYLSGHGLDYVDSSGSPFTGNYINNVGDLMANIQSDLAAELRARKVYEELHRHVDDSGAREMFDFLIQREEAHALLFSEAIERIQDTQIPERSFGDKQYSIMYPDLSQGGQGEKIFKTDDAKTITGPFTGDPDLDTFGGQEPPSYQ
ncbi:manganese catalase family protein [Bacillus sp. FJAT-45350]|uniref:manganese catalase family protein n=1 Tax=Bacillus sp. FJAT-45350 TaxID=2011014 RepID=UPI000BB68939|nr:manganese catalase family protein [Bacillus sp. FJAT-45350]